MTTTTKEIVGFAIGVIGALGIVEWRVQDAKATAEKVKASAVAMAVDVKDDLAKAAEKRSEWYKERHNYLKEKVDETADDVKEVADDVDENQKLLHEIRKEVLK